MVNGRLLENKILPSGLILACLVIMSVQPVYAHGSHTHKTSINDRQEAAGIDNHDPELKSAANPCFRENVISVEEPGEINPVDEHDKNDCCHECSNLFIDLISALNIKTESRRTAADTIHHRIYPVVLTAAPDKGGTASIFIPSTLQSTLRCRVLLI